MKFLRVRFLSYLIGYVSRVNGIAVYESAMKFTPLQSDVDQLVPIILAKAGFEKRQADQQEESEP